MTRTRRALALAVMSVTLAWTLAGVAGTALANTAGTGHGSASYFSATTTASALHVSFTQAPAASIITGSLVNDDAGYATSGFNTGGSSEAAAAPLYPGTLVVGGPGLLCTDLFTCPFTPPPYPLLADASYPRARSAHVVSRKPSRLGSVLSVTPSNATAQAHVSGNESMTATGAVSLLGGTPLALSIGSSAASTKVRSRANAMTVDVTSAVSDIRVGPLLRIGSVRTTDSLTFINGRRPVDRPRVTISGVRIAGQSATITPRGVELKGHHVTSLATKLARSGIEVRALGIARNDDTHSARSSAGGVEIQFAAPIKKAPYIPNPLGGLPGLDQIPGVDLKGTYLGVVQLGGAGAAGVLQHQAGTGPLPPASTAGKPRRHSTVGGQHSNGITPGGTAPGAKVTLPPADSGPPVVAADPSAATKVSFAGLSRDDLMTLYLVLAFGTATIFLGWRGSVGWRRRSGAPGRRR